MMAQLVPLDAPEMIRIDTLSGAEYIMDLFCRYHEHGY